MANTREMRLRIRSIKNIAQVTRALQAVSASNVRKAMAGNAATPARTHPKPGRCSLTLPGSRAGSSFTRYWSERQNIRSILVVLVTGDRGLAGSYTYQYYAFYASSSSIHRLCPVRYVAVGRKGRDLLYRRRKTILAEFSNLPPAPTFADVSAIGRVAVDEFLAGNADEVYLIYTELY